MTETAMRLGTLICLQHLTIPDWMRDRVTNEIWCLWNGVDPSDFFDITMSGMTTANLIRWVRVAMHGNREEIAQFLLCTMHEVSERMASCNQNPPSTGNTEQLVKALT